MRAAASRPAWPGRGCERRQAESLGIVSEPGLGARGGERSPFAHATPLEQTAIGCRTGVKPEAVAATRQRVAELSAAFQSSVGR